MSVLSVLRLCAVGLAVALVPATALSDEWSPPAGYYGSATGSGATLKAQLTSIMSSGHIQRSYGDFRNSAGISDRDPNNASNILLVYNRASVPAAWDSGVTWNREHVWPQSRQPGSASNSSHGNLGDPHALRPATPFVNGARGNDPYAFPETVGSYGSIGSYFFPGDVDKGDIARSLFYSDTRWTSLGLSLVDGFPSGNQMGDLQSLIAWHFRDPPDEFERRRNHTIFSQTYNPIYYTNNRNAYVDRPEFVWSVYVDQQNDSQLFVGAAADSDGGSTLLLADMALTGSSGQQIVALNKNGFDGTYYSVIAQGDAVASPSGRNNAFPINSTGADSQDLTIGIAAAAMSSPGMKSGSVQIDNLDITTGAGLGRGADDADDEITIELMVLDPGVASLAPDMPVDTLIVDLGEVIVGHGPAQSTVPVFNLEQTAGLTADVILSVGANSGDAGSLVAFLPGGVSEVAVPAGDSASVTVGLLDSAAGDFEANYVLEIQDDPNLLGAEAHDPLFLTLQGRVLPLGDINGDLVVAQSDGSAFTLVINGPDVTSPPPGIPLFAFERGDLDNDEDADLHDAATMQTLLGG